ncbi:MAG: DNA mismatch repair protein MutS, partial [bacterium]|nr:DNA mismatch repair protein MutS [bacterium]
MSKTKTKEVTPAMEQYLRFKGEHPDAIVLFRMGDFYETFYEDAREVSRLLGLTLTSRNNGRVSEKVPMAGVPHHALDTYLSRLIKFGKKVAICEQMEPPQKGKAVVRREVTQVVSPGTALTDNLLDQKRNNYLVGVLVDGTRAGLAVTDLSTGAFRVSEVDVDELWERLERIGPAEILAPATWAEANESICAERLSGVLVARQEDWYFGYAYAYEVLTEHFKVASLKGFGCDEMDVGVGAAGAVMRYLQENQKSAISHIIRLSREDSSAYMALDLVTQRNLELITSIQEGRREGTLLSVLDQTCCPMGARALRAWLSQPLLDLERIEGRLDAVDELVRNVSMREDVREALRGVGDLERLMSRICCGRANPRDLVGLKVSLEAVSPLREALEGAEAGLLTRARVDGLPDLGELIDLVAKTMDDEPPAVLSEGGIIRIGYHAELDELREIASGGRSWVARLQAQERERTGIPSLKVGYNKAFGYYIEITRANQEKAPEDYIRKQTLVNAERFITPDLKEWEAKILGADERARDLEKELFQELRDVVAAWVEQVQRTARSVAAVDVLACLAEVAAANDYVRPLVDGSTTIEIREGRHPVVEQLLPGGKFVPNDFFLDGNTDQVLLITGPNMAGKSTILRQVGLIVLLAQVGS